MTVSEPSEVQVEVGHTPGPWKVERAPLTRQLCVMSESTWICGQLQADNHTRIDSAECIANARLIAAAPDLLKALEFIRDGYDNQDVNHVDFRVKAYQVALDAIDSALLSSTRKDERA